MISNRVSANFFAFGSLVIAVDDDCRFLDMGLAIDGRDGRTVRPVAEVLKRNSRWTVREKRVT